MIDDQERLGAAGSGLGFSEWHAPAHVCFWEHAGRELFMDPAPGAADGLGLVVGRCCGWRGLLGGIVANM